MKKITWFYNLSQREQVVVISGLLGLVLLLGYAFIWSPLTEKVTELQQELKEQASLQAWVEHAQRDLAQLNKHSRFERAPVNSVLPVVQHSLAVEGLAIYLKAVQTSQKNQVELALKNIPFDKFITWLQKLLEQHELEVVKFQVNKTETRGVVCVQLLLSGSTHPL